MASNDTKVTLLAHDTLLTKQGPVFGATVQFARDNSEPADDRTYGVPSVLLGVETWRSMGQPEQVTVTIRPGDHLNNDQEN